MISLWNDTFTTHMFTLTQYSDTLGDIDVNIPSFNDAPSQVRNNNRYQKSGQCPSKDTRIITPSNVYTHAPKHFLSPFLRCCKVVNMIISHLKNLIAHSDTLLSFPVLLLLRVNSIHILFLIHLPSMILFDPPILVPARQFSSPSLLTHSLTRQ